MEHLFWPQPPPPGPKTKEDLVKAIECRIEWAINLVDKIQDDPLLTNWQKLQLLHGFHSSLFWLCRPYWLRTCAMQPIVTLVEVPFLAAHGLPGANGMSWLGRFPEINNLAAHIRDDVTATTFLFDSDVEDLGLQHFYEFPMTIVDHFHMVWNYHSIREASVSYHNFLS